LNFTGRRPIAKAAFTLAEMLVSVAVLAILVVLVAQLFSSAANMTGSTIKRINIESQSRPVLDRLAIDLAQMIMRADVDYFTKSPSLPLTGNDRIAFFSQVPGYGASSLSPISLVAYRINSKNRLERMGKALAWNGDTTTVLPLAFLPITISGIGPQQPIRRPIRITKLSRQTSSGSNTVMFCGTAR